MKERAALLQIMRLYVGVNINDLTTLEQQILDIACNGTGMLMPTDLGTAEFTGPVAPPLGD